MFDKTACIDNIYILAKERGIKIGDLEETAGVSKGYLSRIGKDGNTAVPSIEFLSSIADQLKVSVDYLVNYRVFEPTEGEAFLLKFLDKVLHRTICGKLEWQCENASVVNEDSASPVDNPLVSIVDNYSGEFDVLYKTHQFNSRFGNADLIGNTYHADMPGSFAKIYIMKVHYYNEDENGFTSHSLPMYEIYLVEKNITPLCSSYFVRNGIPRMEKINELYQTIETSTSRIGITNDSKKLMENFMSGHWD